MTVTLQHTQSSNEILRAEKNFFLNISYSGLRGARSYITHEYRDGGQLVRRLAAVRVHHDVLSVSCPKTIWPGQPGWTRSSCSSDRRRDLRKRAEKTQRSVG